jgi:hypothetical protein
LAQNDVVRVNGETGAGAKGDLFITQCKIMFGQAGIHVGGAFGGLLIDQADIAGNYNNILVDTALAAEGNRELTFGPGASLDVTSPDGGVSPGGDGILIADTLSNPGYIDFSGSWIASASLSGLCLGSGTNFRVVISGGTIFNNGGDGIKNESSNAVITVDGTRIWSNGQSGTGYGINSTVASPHIQIGSGMSWEGNVSGDFNSNVLTSTLPLYYGPVAWTPGVSFGGGTAGITYTRQKGTYSLVGNRVVLDFSIILSSKGSSTGIASITGLPIASSSDPTQSGTTGAVNGFNFTGLTGAVTAFVQQASSSAVMAQWGAAGTALIDDTTFTNTTNFNGSFGYLRLP